MSEYNGHCFLKPISAAYIAKLWVEHSFMTKEDRSQMELGRNGRKKFHACLKESSNDYLYGAETKGKQMIFLKTTKACLTPEAMG